MSTLSCKAIIQDGPRKGNHCIPVTTVDADGYCTRHQRQKEYDILTTQGKKLCRKFFRGCNSEVTDDEKTCLTCRNKNKKALCIHVYSDGRQCSYEVISESSKYCGKHQRNLYREFEKETGGKICNIDRGCMNLCEPEFQSCKSCIINDYIVNDRYYSEHIDNQNVCIVCENKYESAVLTDALKRCDTCCAEFMNSQKNKQVVQQRSYSNMTIEKYYESYIRGAYKRNNACEFNLTLDEFTNLVTKPCFYCLTKDEHSFNGIDRVNNSGNYILDNCVPCCGVCNRMKHVSSIDEFINKCNAIYMYTCLNQSITSSLFNRFEKYKTLSTLYYSDYKHINDKNRMLEFTLTKDEYNLIRTKPCYLCGVENTNDHYNGIDRVNNTKGYTICNCKSCCGHCNFLKATIPVGIVKLYTKKIALNPIVSSYIIKPIPPSIVDDNKSYISDHYSEPTHNTSERFLSKTLVELFNQSIDTVINYCTTHNRSNIFIRNVKILYTKKHEKTKDELLLTIVRFIDHEKKRNYMAKKEDDDSVKHHKKVNDVLTMLETGKLDEYILWHNEHVGEESTVFRKHLEEFINKFNEMTEQEKIDRCREILKQEKSRRNGKKSHEKIKETKELRETYKLSISSIKQFKPFHVVDVNNILPSKPNIIEHILPDPTTLIVPKQWKTRDIFDFLNANQEHHYKQHCEENNTLPSEWPTVWSEFRTLKGQSWEVAEPLIRAFVENLRRIRHNNLTKKDVLDRDDRQVWPAETVATLFLAGRIAEYKTVTETATGDDPSDEKWTKRWEEFVGTLETLKDDKAGLTKAISKFMTAQRTKKYRRSKA